MVLKNKKAELLKALLEQVDLQNDNKLLKTHQVPKIQTTKTSAKMVFYWHQPTNKVNLDGASLLKARTTLHLLAND